MKNLSQIFCFVKVAERGSFTQAAEALCITATAVSKQVKNFEHSLSEQLFIRHTRDVRLTEFGEILYGQCRDLLKHIDSIEQSIASKKATPQGKLKVLVSTILSQSFVLQHVKAFIDCFPQIDCEILFSEQDHRLGDNDIDIMVGFPQIPPYTEDLRYKKMYVTKNILCASPQLIQSHGMPQSSQALIDYPFISHSLRKPGTSLPLANGERVACAAPRLYMDNFDALNQACIDGIGAFLTGDTLVQDAIKKQHLIQLLPELEFRQYDIFMFYRSYTYEQPKIRAFIDFYSGRLE